MQRSKFCVNTQHPTPTQTKCTHHTIRIPTISVGMTVGLVVGCIVIIFFVARAAWNHYNVKKKKKKKKRYNVQHFDISEEVAAVSLAPQVVESSSIRGWLDMKVKSGYSNKFANAFEETGIEDIDDLAKVDKKVMTQLNEHLVVAGAKAMHLKHIQEAIDEVRTPGAADTMRWSWD